MMARAKVNGLKNVFEAIDKIFENSTQKEKFLREIEDFVTLRVQAETRKGKDLSRDGADQPDLKPSYVAWRKSLEARASALDKISRGSLSSKNLSLVAKITGRTPTPDPTFFKPEKSNLTLTGQLLKSLNSLVKPRARTVEVFVEGRRDDGQTNAAVANDLASRGRTFLGLDKKGVTRIRKMVLDEIRRQIRLRK